jgi:TldD protein
MKKTDTAIRKILSDCVKILTKEGHYADASYRHEHDLTIGKNKTSLDTESGQDEGVRLRIFDGEKFMDYGESGCNKESLEKQAKRMVAWAARNKNTALELKIDKKRLTKSFSSLGKKDPRSIPIQDKIAACEKTYQKLATEKAFVNVRIVYRESLTKSIFVNAYRKLTQDITRVTFIVMPFVQTKSGETRYHYDAFFKPGFEATDVSKKQLDHVKEMAKKIKKAKKIEHGRYDCYLTPEVTGLLAHESFGHGMESDTMLAGRAKAQEYLGKKIAPENVSILENPSYPDAHGTLFFDDEGQLAEPTHLIKDGIVSHPITNQYSISRLDKEDKFHLTANGRAESYDHKIYARMTNTYFDKGKDDPKKMLLGIKDGMYLHYSSGGMEDPKGWGVQIQGIVAERIKNGKLTGEVFYEVGMTG